MYYSGTVSISSLDTSANNIRKLSLDCFDIVRNSYNRTGIYAGDLSDLPPPPMSVEEVEKSITLSTRALGELDFFCSATVDFLQEMDSSISRHDASINTIELNTTTMSEKIDELEDRMRRLFEALENAAPDTTVAELKSMIYYSYQLDEIDTQLKENGVLDAFVHLDNMAKKTYG